MEGLDDSAVLQSVDGAFRTDSTHEVDAALDISTPFSNDDITELIEATKWLRDEERCPDFPGMLWVFPSRADGNRTDALVEGKPVKCNACICQMLLQSFWASSASPAHDSAGVFGFDEISKENRLLWIGTKLRRDIDEMPDDIVNSIPKEDHGRTGTMTALYVTWKTRARILKVSANKGRQMSWWSNGQKRTLQGAEDLRLLLHRELGFMQTSECRLRDGRCDVLLSLSSAKQPSRVYITDQESRAGEPCVGMFGPVWKARGVVESHNASQLFAVKQVLHEHRDGGAPWRHHSNIRDNGAFRLDNVDIEICVLEALSLLKHEHIIALEEVVCVPSASSTCLVLEWGGLEWLEWVNRWHDAYMDAHDKATRKVIMHRRVLFNQLASAVQHLHEFVGYCHLDLSAENALVQSIDITHPVLKLIDFGCARQLERSTLLSTQPMAPHGRRGKLRCMSPEMYDNSTSYDGTLCDMWSMGMILYQVLTAKDVCEYPHKNDPGYASLTALDSDIFSAPGIAVEDKQVLGGLLRVFPSQRLTAPQLVAWTQSWKCDDDMPPHPDLSTLPAVSLESDGSAAEDVAPCAELRRDISWHLGSDERLVSQDADDIFEESSTGTAQLGFKQNHAVTPLRASKTKQEESSTPEFDSCYKLCSSRPIGEGTFGLVWRCASRDQSKHAIDGDRAAKIIRKARLQPRDLRYLLDDEGEIETHLLLEHPHITTLFERFDDSGVVTLVLEYSKGGDLFDAVVHRRGLDEPAAIVVARHVLSALAYLHDLKLVHRDVKCENVLLHHADVELEENIFKLCDFGFVARVKEGGLSDRLGSPDTVAPEVVCGSRYGTEVDIWAMGVVLYMTITATPPFYAETDTEVLRKVRTGSFSFEGRAWDSASQAAKDVVTSMMTLEAARRPSAEQVLQLPWFSQDAEEAVNPSSRV